MPDLNQPTDVTTVTQSEGSIEDIFALPGAENVMLADNNDEKKSNIFSSPKVDMTFLDKPDPEKKSDKPGDVDPKADDKLVTETTVDDIINEFDPGEDDEAKKAGRPKTDKNGLVEIANKLFEKKLLVPFDDEKALEEYSVKDFEELIEANFQEKERQLREEIPGEFFEALPDELQYAAKYVADGGKDLKGLFRALAHVEEARSLDPTDENDSATIARQYLHATNFGTAEEIEEEITSWRDLNKLEKKAEQFKPKLDKMSEQIVAQQLLEQETRQKQQQEASRKYMESIYNTLQPAELFGVKLDKKTQGMLYEGLVQAKYPSISGKPTNLLGHLLEKHQYKEPNHTLIAEVLWHLADPEGFKEKIKGAGAKETTEKTVRLLKTEESKKIASTSPDNETDKQSKGKTLQRPNNGFFKRL